MTVIRSVSQLWLDSGEEKSFEFFLSLKATLMCGIAGIVSQSSDLELIRPMTEAMSHRGPDGSGVWSDGLCSLGHRRLAIIDLSVKGRQPLCNEDETVWIVFNGEIYNFQELRAELESFGHKFSSHTDTEVIVHAYEQWGADCVKRLRGMFAFAIWDQQKRRLFLARDRVGKKPLYYTDTGRYFVFASELQALLQNPEVQREVDLESVDSYLSWGYVPAPFTGFKNVLKLPPAHFLVLDVGRDDTKQVERYWDLQYSPKIRMTEGEAGEALREKLTEAVRYRLISDVPLGAFLSGGIDSSIVVGLMAEVSGARVKTFSIGFDDNDYNELRFARVIAERWGTDHTELIVKPDELAVLPKLVRHYGEPYADSSAIPTFYVSKLTRSGVAVALNGDGGDESFAGYDRYAATRIADTIASFGFFGPATALLARFLPDSIDPKNRVRRAKRFLTVAHQEKPVRYGNWVSYFTPAAKSQLYAPCFADAVAPKNRQCWMEDLWKEVGDLESVDAAMAVDIKSYLPYDLLTKVDIASMANSLEARSPFLDHVVMEFAARLPAHLKLRGRESKYLLKKTFADLLPRQNIRRRKMGFAVPIARWLRTSSRELLQDTLLSDKARDRGYFNPERVDCLVREHITKRTNHSFQLWNLLMLELWQREFVDGCGAAVNDTQIDSLARRTAQSLSTSQA
jgi:asparagine synthase (glutamine-hydrolysing)